MAAPVRSEGQLPPKKTLYEARCRVCGRMLSEISSGAGVVEILCKHRSHGRSCDTRTVFNLTASG